jgi:hypothetical protein
MDIWTKIGDAVGIGWNSSNICEMNCDFYPIYQGSIASDQVSKTKIC